MTRTSILTTVNLSYESILKRSPRTPWNATAPLLLSLRRSDSIGAVIPNCGQGLTESFVASHTDDTFSGETPGISHTFYN